MARNNIWIKVAIATIFLVFSGCGQERAAKQSAQIEAGISLEREEKTLGFGLEVEEKERQEAEQDCILILERLKEIWPGDEGNAEGEILSEQTLLEMQATAKEMGISVVTEQAYSSMENYEKADGFLRNAKEGKSGNMVLYELQKDGAVAREKFSFDGQDMYVISTRGIWKKDGTAGISEITRNRIKTWEYTQNGWFLYELCVPEPPMVSEVVDGGCAFRILPMSEETRELSEMCLLGLGYQGNNVLRCDWDTAHMEDLDFNGVYEYLYWMEYGKPMELEAGQTGIPAPKFEELIMKYFPITREQLRLLACYDEKTDTYGWERLGCFNYTPSFFDTSLPEATAVLKNEDGSLTLTVDAVCEMVHCDDAVITHELTVKFREDGSFQYLGNKILRDKKNVVSEYSRRLETDET